MPSRLVVSLVAGLVTLALAACGGSSTSSSSSTSTPAASAPSSTAASSTSTAATGSQISYEGVPIQAGTALAPASSTQTGNVDGIRCGATEQLAYHIHAHLAVFDNGVIRALPAGIGIAGSTTQQTAQGPVAAGGQCIYWLHTHTADGIIHVESPTQRIYTLGNFFDEWHQPLSADQVGTVRGRITAYYNHVLWPKSLRDIPLTPHALIQLDVGNPAPPLVSVTWSQTGL
jgi:hypothetical protein